MREILWSDNARKDLQSIYEYYQMKNPTAALTIYKKIRGQSKILADFPGIAPIEELLADEPIIFRSLLVLGTFKIIYYFENDIIYISKVWDCRQNPLDLRI